MYQKETHIPADSASVLTSQKTSRKSIPALTGLRCIAAITVVLAHSLALIARGHTNIESSSFLQFLEGMPALGMPLFFILSGFVIHYNYFSNFSVQGKVLSGLFVFFRARFGRLYPLFLLIIINDLWWSWGGTDRIPDAYGHWLWYRALPKYLFLIHTWYFAIIGNNNLIYQIGMSEPVTWSISTEWFFYLAYPLLTYFLIRLVSFRLTLGALAAYSLIVFVGGYYAVNFVGVVDHFGARHFGPIAKMDNGFQDSFVRWLFYFSPYCRISEFILGCITCHLYQILIPVKVSKCENRIGAGLLFFGILLTCFLLWAEGSAYWAFILRLVFGIAPALAIILFCVSRYHSVIVDLLSSRLFQIGGELSYSFYLLHFPIFLAVSKFVEPHPTFELFILKVAIGMVLLVSTSLVTYYWYEIPLQRWIRKIGTTSWIGAAQLFALMLGTFFSVLLFLHWNFLGIIMISSLWQHWLS